MFLSLSLSLFLSLFPGLSIVSSLLKVLVAGVCCNCKRDLHYTQKRPIQNTKETFVNCYFASECTRLNDMRNQIPK